MAHSFLIFDFGENEEAAQLARHRIDGWKQGFRLDKKLQLKFDRKETEANPVEATPSASATEKSSSKGKKADKEKSKSGGKAGKAAETITADAPPSEVRVIVRLDFSDHEKLSHQRWLERIPTEEPFKTASPKIVRAGDPEFQKTSDLFDSLD